MGKFKIPVLKEKVQSIKEVCEKHPEFFKYIGYKECDGYVQVEVEAKEASQLYTLGVFVERGI